MATEPMVLLIVGAGGHGRAVAELARLAGFGVAGFLDADPPAAVVDGLPVWAEAVDGIGGLPGGAGGIGLGIGDNAARARAASRYQAYPRPPLVHPRAIVSPSAMLSPGVVVFPGAVVHTGAEVGEGAVVNSGAIVEHHCRVGAAAHVAPGAVLCGAVRVGAGALVGAGAVVIPGCAVGARAVVGAGAVVTADVPDDAVVAGVPARLWGGRGD